MRLLFQDGFWVVHIPFFFRVVKFQTFAQFPVDHLANTGATLLHSLNMWLIISFLSPHNLHLLFCCILSILALIILVLIALFCAAFRSDSVSLKRFPFFSHVQVFSCEMSLVFRLKCPYDYFSFHFCFLFIFVLLILVLSVLFLVAVVSFSMLSLSRYLYKFSHQF